MMVDKCPLLVHQRIEIRDKRLDIRDKRIEGKEGTQMFTPILYGDYKNIRLTDEKCQKLQEKV